MPINFKYHHSVRNAFHGDYVSIRRHTTWKNNLRRNGLKKLDRHVVFADIVNKMHMSNGKVYFVGVKAF